MITSRGERIAVITEAPGTCTPGAVMFEIQFPYPTSFHCQLACSMAPQDAIAFGNALIASATAVLNARGNPPPRGLGGL